MGDFALPGARRSLFYTGAMNSMHSEGVEPLAITSIEGAPTRGVFRIKPMLRGECMSVLEVHLQPGVASGLHTHGHESMLYVVRGRVRTVVGDDVLELGSGDVGCHPAGVPHSVEALEETVFVEIKSPAPAIGKVLTAQPG